MIYLENDLSFLNSSWFILFLAAIFRLLFVFRLPELSDDIFRYLFDGLQLLGGNNPYALSPSNAALLKPSLGMLVSKINHPDLVTIYPPASQLTFLSGSIISPHILGIKVLLSCMDIGTCALIISLLSDFKLPANRSILYAWHPLAILEISGSGHIDAAGIFFFFLSIAIVVKLCAHNKPLITEKTKFKSNPYNAKRVSGYLLAGVLYAFSSLVKLLPSVYFFFYVKMLPSKPRHWFLTGAFAGGTLLCIPFLPDLIHMADALFVYSRHWEFSGLLYRSLIAGKVSGDVSRLLLISGFIFIFGLVYFYPDRITRWKGQNKHLFPMEEFIFQVYIITLAFMVFTPTLYPWYALYLIVLLPFIPNLFGIILSWSVLLSYRVLILYAYSGQWSESDMMPVLIWAGPLLGFVLQRIFQNRFSHPTAKQPIF